MTLGWCQFWWGWLLPGACRTPLADPGSRLFCRQRLSSPRPLPLPRPLPRPPSLALLTGGPGLLSTSPSCVKSRTQPDPLVSALQPFISSRPCPDVFLIASVCSLYVQLSQILRLALASAVARSSMNSRWKRGSQSWTVLLFLMCDGVSVGVVGGSVEGVAVGGAVSLSGVGMGTLFKDSFSGSDSSSSLSLLCLSALRSLGASYITTSYFVSFTRFCVGDASMLSRVLFTLFACGTAVG